MLDVPFGRIPNTHLTVLAKGLRTLLSEDKKRSGHRKGYRAIYTRCDCGKEQIMILNSYLFKPGVSCGHTRLERVRESHISSRVEVLLGRVDGTRLTVVANGLRFLPNFKQLSKGRKGDRAVQVRCDCGNEKLVRIDAIVGKLIVSCGCFNSEQAAIRGADRFFKHGYTDVTHAYYTIYTSWCSMKSRCYNVNNPKYLDYGARGISVCQEWIDNSGTFVDWIIENLGNRPPSYSLDRINNDGNYEPGNLRWATAEEQMANRRNSVDSVS